MTFKISAPKIEVTYFPSLFILTLISWSRAVTLKWPRTPLIVNLRTPIGTDVPRTLGLEVRKFPCPIFIWRLMSCWGTQLSKALWEEEQTKWSGWLCLGFFWIPKVATSFHSNMFQGKSVTTPRGRDHKKRLFSRGGCLKTSWFKIPFDYQKCHLKIDLKHLCTKSHPPNSQLYGCRCFTCQGTRRRLASLRRSPYLSPWQKPRSNPQVLHMLLLMALTQKRTDVTYGEGLPWHYCISGKPTSSQRNPNFLRLKCAFFHH